MRTFILSFLAILGLLSCKKNQTTGTTNDGMYFPSTTTNDWEIATSISLKWNQTAIQPLKNFWFKKNTKSFMILVNGRIVMEEYFNGHTAKLYLGME